MNNIMQTIQNNYKVNGNDGKYLTHYANKGEVINESKENERDVEEFLVKYNVVLDELIFPIITFDNEDSPDSGTLLDSTNDREEILSEAHEYFELLNDGEGVWEFEEYIVYEESGVLRFENSESDILGYTPAECDAPNKSIDNIELLNKGADPIYDGWEDGLGNGVNLDGWNLE